MQKLFPDIWPKSVTLLPHTMYVVKQAMDKWLDENHISFSVDMKKDRLLELIERFKPAEYFILTE